MKLLEPTWKPKVIYTDKSLEFGKILWRTILDSLYVKRCTDRKTNGICERAVMNGGRIPWNANCYLRKHSRSLSWEDTLCEAVRNTIWRDRLFPQGTSNTWQGWGWRAAREAHRLNHGSPGDLRCGTLYLKQGEAGTTIRWAVRIEGRELREVKGRTGWGLVLSSCQAILWGCKEHLFTWPCLAVPSQTSFSLAGRCWTKWAACRDVDAVQSKKIRVLVCQRWLSREKFAGPRPLPLWHHVRSVGGCWQSPWDWVREWSVGSCVVWHQRWITASSVLRFQCCTTWSPRNVDAIENVSSIFLAVRFCPVFDGQAGVSVAMLLELVRSRQVLPRCSSRRNDLPPHNSRWWRLDTCFRDCLQVARTLYHQCGWAAGQATVAIIREEGTKPSQWTLWKISSRWPHSRHQGITWQSTSVGFTYGRTRDVMPGGYGGGFSMPARPRQLDSVWENNQDITRWLAAIVVYLLHVRECALWGDTWIWLLQSKFQVGDPSETLCAFMGGVRSAFISPWRGVWHATGWQNHSFLGVWHHSERVFGRVGAWCLGNGSVGWIPMY